MLLQDDENSFQPIYLTCNFITGAVEEHNRIGTSMDEEFVRLSLLGDREAFRKLVDRYAQRVYSFCRRRVSNEDDANDLAQEVFVRALQSLPNLQKPAGFGGWLFGIARNQCRMYLRRFGESERPIGDMDEQVSSEVDAEEHLRVDSLRSLIGKLVDRLTAEQREVVESFYWDGLSYDEIGILLNLPATTIKSRLFEARRSLRNALNLLLRDIYRLHGLPASFAQEVISRCGEGCECGLMLNEEGGAKDGRT